MILGRKALKSKKETARFPTSEGQAELQISNSYA